MYRNSTYFNEETLKALAQIKEIPSYILNQYNLMRVEKDDSNWCCNNKHNFEFGPVSVILKTRIAWHDVVNTMSYSQKFHISCALGLKKCTRYRVAYMNKYNKYSL